MAATSLVWITHRSPRHDALPVVVLHGFGADAADLAALADELDPRRHFHWFFPQAPVPLFPGSWAWFPRDGDELTMALQGSLWANLPDYDSPSIDVAMDLVLKDCTVLGIEASTTIWAGFSQGSMMALFLQRNAGGLGLLLWSSALVAKNRLARTPGLPCPCIQSHGTQDGVLSLGGALALGSFLDEGAYPRTWVEFEGGHSLADVVIEKSRHFLEEISEGHPRSDR